MHFGFFLVFIKSTDKFKPLTITNLLSYEDLFPVIILIHSIAIIELIIPTSGARTPVSEQELLSIKSS